MKFSFFSDGSAEKKNKVPFLFGFLLLVGLFLLVVILPNVYGMCEETVPPWECNDNIQIQLSKEEHCAFQFDELVNEIQSRPPPACALPSSSIQCEPVGTDGLIRNDQEFMNSSCPETFKRWAYLSEHNDIAWFAFGPNYYQIKMDKVNTEEFISIKVQKYDFTTCDDFSLYILTHDEKRELVYSQDFVFACNEEGWGEKQSITLDLSEQATIQLPKGEYYAFLYRDKLPESYFVHESKYEGDFNSRIEYEELTKFYFSSHYDHPELQEPIISDEQRQMMQDYCETGIRHPDMMGIPQCIKDEPICDPYDYGCGVPDESDQVGFYGLLEIYAIILSPILIVGIVLVFIVLRKRK